MIDAPVGATPIASGHRTRRVASKSRSMGLSAEERARRCAARKRYYWKHREVEISRKNAWAAANPDKVKVHTKRAYQKRREKSRIYCIQKRYGITIEAFDQMLLNQDGRCAICHADDCTLCVDHCHESNRVRGLLCSACNTAIGKFNDKPSNLSRAIAYLAA